MAFSRDPPLRVFVAFYILPALGSPERSIFDDHSNLPTTKRPRIRYSAKTSTPSLPNSLGALGYTAQGNHPKDAGSPKVDPELASPRRLAPAKLSPPPG